MRSEVKGEGHSDRCSHGLSHHSTETDARGLDSGSEWDRVDPCAVTVHPSPFESEWTRVGSLDDGAHVRRGSACENGMTFGHRIRGACFSQESA